MTWTKQKDEIVWEGVETGIAPSPLKGTANIQNANISTDSGEVMASFGRVAQQQTVLSSQTLTASVGAGATLLAAPASLQAGQWITVSATTIGALTTTASYLAVGGGGGGGASTTDNASGGGGGGGMLTGTFSPSVGVSYAITVGAGGAGGTSSANGTTGGNTAIGTLMPSTVSVQAVVVGGGGGGGASGAGVAAGSNAGGGGGAGSVKAQTLGTLAFGTYAITIGSGGQGGQTTSSNGANGTSSSFNSITAAGGGGGAGATAGSNAGLSGASGGGGAAGGGAGGGGAATDGFAGGAAASGSPNKGGGGGGASQAGNTAGQMIGGNGTASSISGASVTYGGGGGGGASSGGAGAGGSGGGGSGGNSAAGTNGTANTGGGGGGGSTSAGNTRVGGDGGSGVVILRFTPATGLGYVQIGGVVTSSGGDTIITWTSAGSITFGNALGGGGGGAPGIAGSNGGSGGGGSSNSNAGASAGGTGSTGQGNNGGTGVDSATVGNRAGGGGGGASAVGSNAASAVGGAGGNGTASSISGTSVTYGGGGGGGASSTFGAGGTGGAGAGNNGVDPTSLNNGVNGLGGGGGGNWFGFNGGSGGSGVVIISYATGSMSATGGNITFSGGNTIHTFTSSGTFTIQSIAAAGQYFVSFKNTSNQIKLSAVYDPYCLNPIAHGTTGTATFSTLAVPNSALAKATETYGNTSATAYRYYILDANSRVWVYDSAVYDASLAASGVGTKWMLPDPTDDSAQLYTGMAILNGWLFVLNKTYIRGKPTSTLGATFGTLTNGYLVNPFSTHTNFAYVGHQGKMYYCDGNYIGSIFPTTSVLTGAANIQSFASYTCASSMGTITSILSGSLPYTTDTSGTVTRIPAIFFPDNGGSMPAGLTAATVYYIQVNITAGTFQVYTALTGGVAVNFSAVGTQYFNTFYPTGADSGINGTHSTVTFSNQRVNLPANEVAQCMVEIGNTVLIGGISNTLYPWNQVDVTPSDLIALPEANVKSMVNVNNMAYIFAGYRGNIYISNGSVASLVLKVPDYCAGVPGTPTSYIEPVYTWGDSMYVRGRVYFSLLDQNATKSGNCGGVWSFVPSQNVYVQEDAGTALRLENQNSYATYSGVASILLPSQTQSSISPQYWAAWQDSYSTGTSNFGIDGTNTVPATTYIVETDLLETGTFLQKQTNSQIEYKLTTPLITGDSVQLYYRLNATDAWTSCGAVVQETANPISGYFEVNFQNTQWLQLRAVCTTTGDVTSSFTRLRRIWFR